MKQEKVSYQKISDKVYEIVKKIPKGKVTTYGMISKKLGKIRGKKINPRYVGYILHKNPDPERIPCHRVVNSKGELSKNYRFGGWENQKKKLSDEVKFKDEKRVDLGKCLLSDL